VKYCIGAYAPGELIGFRRTMHYFDRKRASRFSGPPVARLAIHSALAALAALILST
jgi:hypothetical protein